MQGNLVGVLFNCLLAELPTILNSFLSVPWEPQSGWENTCCVVTLVLWIFGA